MISVRGHDQRSRPNLPTHMRSVRHSLAVRSEAIKVCSITFGMAAEPSDESKWLKSHYEEAATGDVPTPSKRVKYQTLKDDIELHFPHRTYNDLVVN